MEVQPITVSEYVTGDRRKPFSECLHSVMDALDYLNICLDDPDPGLFLLAFRDLARAYGGMAALSRKAGLNREALYQTLSKRGNPTLAKLESLLDAPGFRLKIERK